MEHPVHLQIWTSVFLYFQHENYRTILENYQKRVQCPWSSRFGSTSNCRLRGWGIIINCTKGFSNYLSRLSSLPCSLHDVPKTSISKLSCKILNSALSHWFCVYSLSKMQKSLAFISTLNCEKAFSFERHQCNCLQITIKKTYYIHTLCIRGSKEICNNIWNQTLQ
jgi:hypothetical protein